MYTILSSQTLVKSWSGELKYTRCLPTLDCNLLKIYDSLIFVESFRLLRIFFAASIGFQVPIKNFGSLHVVRWG